LADIARRKTFGLGNVSDTRDAFDKKNRSTKRGKAKHDELAAKQRAAENGERSTRHGSTVRRGPSALAEDRSALAPFPDIALPRNRPRNSAICFRARSSLFSTESASPVLAGDGFHGDTGGIGMQWTVSARRSRRRPFSSLGDSNGRDPEAFSHMLMSTLLWLAALCQQTPELSQKR